MRCPPLVGSKLPREKMEHQPQDRLALSQCGTETVLGPKLMVTAAKAVPS